MIRGELLDTLRDLPYQYEEYFNSLYRAAEEGDPSKIITPEVPEELSPTELGKEVQEGTAELSEVFAEDLRELSNPLKIGFAYMKVNQTTPYWACYYKRGITPFTEEATDTTDNTDIDEQGSQL